MIRCPLPRDWFTIGSANIDQVQCLSIQDTAEGDIEIRLPPKHGVPDRPPLLIPRAGIAYLIPIDE